MSPSRYGVKQLILWSLRLLWAVRARDPQNTPVAGEEHRAGGAFPASETALDPPLVRGCLARGPIARALPAMWTIRLRPSTLSTLRWPLTLPLRRLFHPDGYILARPRNRCKHLASRIHRDWLAFLPLLSNSPRSRQLGCSRCSRLTIPNLTLIRTPLITRAASNLGQEPPQSKGIRLKTHQGSGKRSNRTFTIYILFTNPSCSILWIENSLSITI